MTGQRRTTPGTIRAALARQGGAARPLPHAFEELEDSNRNGDHRDDQPAEPKQQPHLPVLDLCLKLHLDFLNLGEEPQFRVSNVGLHP